MVQFDGSGSFDPKGDFLRYDWDLDGDGSFGDSSEEAPSYQYDNPGQYLVQLEVTDDFGATDIDTVLIDVTSGANTPPTATIDTPSLVIHLGSGGDHPLLGFGNRCRGWTSARQRAWIGS